MNKKDILILDIETFSKYDISKEFEKYVETAKVRFIGFYTYNREKCFEIEVKGNENLIKEFIKEHKVIVSFNGIEFDIPILKNNNLYPDNYKIDIDLKVVLSSDVKKGHKKRGELMGYKFRKNSLKEISKIMGAEEPKGDIDYNIFEKETYTEEEIKEIKKYLRTDIELTKFIFDKTYDFWLPFANFISEKNRNNYSWINSSIASLVYKSCCNIMNWEETYGEKGKKDEMGGFTMEPTVEEAWDIWYVDEASQYPHNYVTFNLINEVSKDFPGAWHGNEVFKVRGYYDISKHHKLCQDMAIKLKERERMKKEDPKNGLIKAYKIFLNTIYGTNRSPVFEALHTENSGYDCCWLGQQKNIIMQEKGKEMGYTTINADTDSNFWKHKEKKTREQVEADLKKVTDYIKKYLPFPVDTFKIDIEKHILYIMFVKDEKKAKKKNYAYVYEKKDGSRALTVMGLPISKVNATNLGPLILKKHIKPRMLKELQGKFEASWVESLIKEELEKDLSLMLQEYKCSSYNSYGFKGKSCLTAQISKNYFDGKSGYIELIKNKKIGKVGSSFKYCTLEEAKNLKIEDLDLTKVYNELSPFTKGGLNYKNKKKSHKAPGFFNSSVSEKTIELQTKGGFFK